MKDHFSKIMRSQKQQIDAKIQGQSDKVNQDNQILRKEFNIMK
jgi:hypothetical protein